MHAIVIYQLLRARMEVEREAERRRRAQAERPSVRGVPAGIRVPRARAVAGRPRGLGRMKEVLR
jgi:hypothetical protein